MLTGADGGTDMFCVQENLPPALSPADKETGWRMALDRLTGIGRGGSQTRHYGPTP